MRSDESLHSIQVSPMGNICSPTASSISVLTASCFSMVETSIVFNSSKTSLKPRLSSSSSPTAATFTKVSRFRILSTSFSLSDSIAHSRASSKISNASHGLSIPMRDLARSNNGSIAAPLSSLIRPAALLIMALEASPSPAR